MLNSVIITCSQFLLVLKYGREFLNLSFSFWFHLIQHAIDHLEQNESSHHITCACEPNTWISLMSQALLEGSPNLVPVYFFPSFKSVVFMCYYVEPIQTSQSSLNVVFCFHSKSFCSHEPKLNLFSIAPAVECVHI